MEYSIGLLVMTTQEVAECMKELNFLEREGGWRKFVDVENMRGDELIMAIEKRNWTRTELSGIARFSESLFI